MLTTFVSIIKYIIFMMSLIFYVKDNINENLSYIIISGEITLVTIYFTLLPIIIDSKNKNSYLGIKVSTWILYSNEKKEYLFNHFVRNIICIVTSVIFRLFGLDYLILLLFIFIIVFFINDMKETISNVSTDKPSREIEEYFIELAKNDISHAKELIELDFVDNNETTIKSDVLFLLKNNMNNDIHNIFQVFLNKILDRYWAQYGLYIFKTLSDDLIEKGYSEINIDIDSIFYQYLFEQDLSDSNMYAYREILSTFSIVLIQDKNKRDYLMPVSFINYIIKNKKLCHDNKIMLLKDLFFIFSLYIRDKNSKKYFDIYIHLYKSVIRNNYSLLFKSMIDSIKKSIDYQSPQPTNQSLLYLGVMIYLYYILKIENSKYFTDKEREYIKNIHDELRINTLYGYLYDVNSINILFNWLNDCADDWEEHIFDFGEIVSVKNPAVKPTIDLTKKALFLYVRSSFIDSNTEFYDYEISLFSSCISNDYLSEACINKIYEFWDFIGISRDDIYDEISKEYIKSIIQFSKNSFIKRIKKQSYSKRKINSLIRRIRKEIGINNENKNIKSNHVLRNKSISCSSIEINNSVLNNNTYLDYLVDNIAGIVKHRLSKYPNCIINDINYSLLENTNNVISDDNNIKQVLTKEEMKIYNKYTVNLELIVDISIINDVSKENE